MSSNAVVHLNVGGRLFTTTHATLTSLSAQGSMLETMANLHLQQQQQQRQPRQTVLQPADFLELLQGQGSQDSSTETGSGATTVMQPTLSDPQHPDALFIDRDGDCFGYILGHLRDGPEAVLPSDLHTTQQLLREAQYYQLTGLVQLLQAQVLTLTEVVEVPSKQLKELQNINRNTSRTPEDVGKMLETLKCMSETLGEMRTYLVPKVAYHTGKRGGPNYSRPRQFLDDLGDIMPLEDTRRR